MNHDTEPTRATDPELIGVLNELRQREPIFHRQELGTGRADFENMTAREFWEIGASGRRYSREYVLAELERRYSAEYVDRWETSDFRCQRLANELYLLTYTLLQGKRKTRRTTIWRRRQTSWQIVFHQGTIVHIAAKRKTPDGASGVPTSCFS
jgi:hypothetical protein